MKRATSNTTTSTAATIWPIAPQQAADSRRAPGVLVHLEEVKGCLDVFGPLVVALRNHR